MTAPDGNTVDMTRATDMSQPAPDRPVIGWIEALFIVCLIVISLSFIAGGAFLRLRGMPATDRSGTIVGSIVLRGQGASAVTNAFAADPGHAVVVAVSTDDGRRVAVAKVGATGDFRLQLAPGEYILRTQARGVPLSAAPRRVLLQGGQVLDEQVQASAASTSASAAR